MARVWVSLFLWLVVIISGVVWIIPGDLGVNWWAGLIAGAVAMIETLGTERNPWRRLVLSSSYGLLGVVAVLIGALKSGGFMWLVFAVVGILWLYITLMEGFWLIYEKKDS